MLSSTNKSTTDDSRKLPVRGAFPATSRSGYTDLLSLAPGSPDPLGLVRSRLNGAHQS